MDKTLIFDLSSDDEVGVDDHSTSDNFDWIAKFLEDVGSEIDVDSDPIINGGLFNLGNVIEDNETKDDNDNDNDDDDDVVVVGEVIVPKMKKVKTLVNRNDVNDDDDCVVLEGDPDKPKEEVKDPEKDPDDLVIVGETGQVACRDYPHPRHLCAKFPFSSTPHENHCEMCHCYVCDSLAPCTLWSSGILSIDHCHATDKEECWKNERKKIKQLKNPTPPIPMTKPNAASLPQFHHRLQQLSTGPKQFSRPTAGSVSSTFGLPNIVRNQRSSMAVASTRFQPNLISRQHLRSCNGNTQVQGHRGTILSPKLGSSRPMFKRSGPPSRPVVSNRPTFRAPNNVTVACLQLPDQQSSGNLNENSCDTSMVSSLHLNLNTCIYSPNTNSISPVTFPSLLQGYNQPSPHTPASQFHDYDHSAAVASNSPYTTLNQAQNIPDVVHPSYNNVQNSSTQCGEQQSGVTQAMSGPNFPTSVPDALSSITQKGHRTSTDHSYSNAIFAFSTSNAPNIVPQSLQQTSVAETPLAQGGVPMHELLPSIEQNTHPSGNPENLDFDFENWLQDGEPLGSHDSSFFFDINNQASVPVPVDTGMLYFDFETSWKGLAHS